MSDFLGLSGKKFLVTGVANKKSVAYHTANLLEKNGAEVILSVRDEAGAAAAAKLFPSAKIYVCDVEKDEDIASLGAAIKKDHGNIQGFVHSIAFANFSEGVKPFHEVKKKDFLQAMDISCFSFIALANALKDVIDRNGSAVTISISATTMTAESYGYMAPVKAALDSSVAFLAKSFSAFSNIRFNAVGASLLKTSASAGIPGYLDYYILAEKFTLRKKNLLTEEVASTAVFLLSHASSGINARCVVVDAGMGVNFFDREIIELTNLGAKARPQPKKE